MDTERAIILKTINLIGRKGIRFTTEELAKELGTSKRTIYSYVSTKDELIEKTIDFIFDEIGSSDTEILENNQLTLHKKIELCFQNVPNMYNLTSIVRHMDDLQKYYPELWAKVDHDLDTIWEPIIQLVEQGIKTGELETADTTILKLLLNQTLRKLLDYDFLSKNHVSFDSGLKALSKIILYGLIKHEAQ